MCAICLQDTHTRSYNETEQREVEEEKRDETDSWQCGRNECGWEEREERTSSHRLRKCRAKTEEKETAWTGESFACKRVRQFVCVVWQLNQNAKASEFWCELEWQQQ